MSGLITTNAEYEYVCIALSGNHDQVIAVDTETTGLNPFVCDEIRGISVATRYDEWYLPISHPDSKNFDPWPLIQSLERSSLVFFNAPFDWLFLLQVKDDLEWWIDHTCWDALVVNWLWDENLKNGLKPSTSRIFGTEADDEQKHLKSLKGKTWATYSAEDIGLYAAKDARLTWDLADWQVANLQHRTPDVRPAIPREMKVQASLARMMATGVAVDPDKAAEGEAKMLARIDTMNEQFALEGVNPASTKDVGRWLYDEKGHPCLIHTAKGARSTAVAALQALHDSGCEEATRLLEHRKLQKAITAYFRPLRQRIGDDGRVHASFASTRTVTGRFSCSNPNLQTIPRGDTLPEVRECFVARPGYELWEFDLAQAELRVIAGYANEPAMIDALENGRDLHSETAESMWGPDFTPLQRRFAKNLNFGFAYYIGPEKFATYISPVPSRCHYWLLVGKQRFGQAHLKCGTCDVCEADIILEGYRQTYPNLLRVRDGMLKIAERDGYVPSISPGRFRHFKGAGYRVAAYTAFNFIVQGGIGEFMKDVMNEWYDHRADWERTDPGFLDTRTRLCLQVHDSLWFETVASSGHIHSGGQTWADETKQVLQGIADRINPFAMRMIFDSKQIA